MAQRDQNYLPLRGTPQVNFLTGAHDKACEGPVCDYRPCFQEGARVEASWNGKTIFPHSFLQSSASYTSPRVACCRVTSSLCRSCIFLGIGGFFFFRRIKNVGQLLTLLLSNLLYDKSYFIDMTTSRPASTAPNVYLDYFVCL